MTATFDGDFTCETSAFHRKKSKVARGAIAGGRKVIPRLVKRAEGPRQRNLAHAHHCVI